MTIPPPDDHAPHQDPTPTPPADVHPWGSEPPFVDPAPTPSAALESAPSDAPARPRGLPLPSHPVLLTRVLLLVNILLFVLLSFLSRGNPIEAALEGADTRTLIALGAKENGRILMGEYWRLITPIFLHIGIVHLLFNSYALNIFGREVESMYGSVRFAVIYFLSGIAGSLLSFAFSPYTSAGASGAIFGVIGALAAFLIRNREMLGAQGKQQLQSVAWMIGLNLVLGFTLPGIDNYGHMGGLAAGFLLGFLLSPTYSVEPSRVPPLYAHVVERPRALPTAAVAAGGFALLSVLFWLALPLAPL